MLKVKGILALARSHMQDWKFLWGRRLGGFAFLFAAYALFTIKRDTAGTSCLMRANRFSNGTLGVNLLIRKLPLIKRLVPRLLPDAVDLNSLDGRCLVLAEPELEEGRLIRRGVLLASFTETSGKLYASVDTQKLFSLFHVVLEPSSAGYADPCLLCWLNSPEPVIVQTPEMRDRELLRRLDTNLFPVDYGAGDWIDPERFDPAHAGPSLGFNAVAITNFGWWKRNHAFVEAVAYAAQKTSEYRAAIVLARWGKSKRSTRYLRNLIAWYGIESKIEVFEGLKQKEVNTLLSHSDVLVFTSWKEGSSRVIFEAMCADCPVLVLARNIGVNKNYINEYTGKIVPDEKLGAVLLDFNKRHQKQCPRNWFLENLGPANSTRKLATDIARLFPDENWLVEDLIIKGNTPEARYLGKGGHPRPLSFWMSL